MTDTNIMAALTALSGGDPCIMNTGNIWYSTKQGYAGFSDRMKDIVSREDIRGTVLIASDEDIIWASGTRSKDISGNVVSPVTTYEIGSVTKTFTACCIFRLIEEGKLRLSDRVMSFFPGYTKAVGMTVYDLLHMRSGIADFANEFDVFFDMEHKDKSFETDFWAGKVSDEVLLENMYRLDLRFAPASKTEYSNTNYVLLAMIIEKLTGKTYKECMEAMFDELGMTSSSAVAVGDVTSIPEETDGYHLAQHSARGAGDIHTNVLDMLRFDRAYFSDKVVSHKSVETMLTLDDGYGCGWTSDGFCWWHNEGEPYDTDMVFHGGETLSYTCDNIVFNVKTHRLYVILMSPCFKDNGRKIIGLCREFFCNNSD